MVTKELSTVVNLMTSVRVFFVPGRSGGGGGGGVKGGGVKNF